MNVTGIQNTFKGVVGSLKGNSVIGLDIGTSSIKLVELERKNGTAVVRNAAQCRNPAAGEEISEEKRLVLMVRGLKQEYGVRANRTVSTLSKRDITEKFLTVPADAGERVGDIVKWEVPKHISFPVEDAVYDFRVDELQGGGELGIHLAITRRRNIEKHVELLMRMGLVPEAVETRSRALHRLIDRTVDTEASVVAALDIGSRWSTMLIINNGVLRMSRTMEIGSDDINSSIVNLVRCSENDAESLKRKMGFTEEIMKGESVSATSKEFHVYSAIEMHMDRLIAEMKRSLVFYYAKQEAEDEPEILFVTGGAARIPNLGRFIEKKLGFEVRINDPSSGFTNEAGETMELGAHLSMALGLALRKL